MVVWWGTCAFIAKLKPKVFAWILIMRPVNKCTVVERR